MVRASDTIPRAVEFYPISYLEQRKEDIYNLIKSSPLLLLSGPKFYGKREFLAHTIENLSHSTSEKWVIKQIKFSNIRLLANEKELTDDETLQLFFYNIFVSPLQKLENNKFLNLKNFIYSIQSYLHTTKHSFFIVLEGIEKINDPLLIYFLCNLRNYKAVASSQESPWNRLRIVLISHVDSLLLLDGFGLSLDDSWPYNVTDESHILNINKRIDYNDMTEICTRYDLCWSEYEKKHFLDEVGGHPYLIFLLIKRAIDGVDTTTLMKTISDRNGPLKPFLKTFYQAIITYRQQDSKPKSSIYPADQVKHSIGWGGDVSGLEDSVLEFYSTWDLVEATRSGGAYHGQYKWTTRIPAVLRYLRNL